LLEKTHTSSGRIPSEKGYRYYVDNIMVPKELTGEDMLKLEKIFHNHSLALSDTILKSLEIISEITNSAAIVLGNSACDHKLARVEVIPIDEVNLVALIVTDKGHVENKMMYLEEKISMSEVKQIVDIMNKHLKDTSLNDVSAKLEYEIKPIIGTELKQKKALYEAFLNVFNDIASNEVKVASTSYMLKEPEFDNVEKIRGLISKFEDKEIVKNIKEDTDGINIYIGSENEFDDDVTIIKAKYTANNEEGTIALVGPKRMEYDKATALLNYIIKNIERK
jgi:heat-inducible transcriptional repressor